MTQDKLNELKAKATDLYMSIVDLNADLKRVSQEHHGILSAIKEAKIEPPIEE